MEGINRTNEDWRVATARVHVEVSNRSVRKIADWAFGGDGWRNEIAKTILMRIFDRTAPSKGPICKG